MLVEVLAEGDGGGAVFAPRMVPWLGPALEGEDAWPTLTADKAEADARLISHGYELVYVLRDVCNAIRPGWEWHTEFHGDATLHDDGTFTTECRCGLCVDNVFTSTNHVMLPGPAASLHVYISGERLRTAWINTDTMPWDPVVDRLTGAGDESWIAAQLERFLPLYDRLNEPTL